LFSDKKPSILISASSKKDAEEWMAAIYPFTEKDDLIPLSFLQSTTQSQETISSDVSEKKDEQQKEQTTEETNIRRYLSVSKRNLSTFFKGHKMI